MVNSITLQSGVNLSDFIIVGNVCILAYVAIFAFRKLGHKFNHKALHEFIAAIRLPVLLSIVSTVTVFFSILNNIKAEAFATHQSLVGLDIGHHFDKIALAILTLSLLLFSSTFILKRRFLHRQNYQAHFRFVVGGSCSLALSNSIVLYILKHLSFFQSTNSAIDLVDIYHLYESIFYYLVAFTIMTGIFALIFASRIIQGIENFAPQKQKIIFASLYRHGMLYYQSLSIFCITTLFCLSLAIL